MSVAYTTSDTQMVTLTSTSTDPDGTIVSYLWAIGGGTPTSATTAVVNGVTFRNLHPYPVTLMVVDDHGVSDSATQTMMPCLP